MIKRLLNEDVGKMVVYKPNTNIEDVGRLKTFDNTNQIAWVVYKWGVTAEWENYTAQATNYSDLEFANV